MHKSDAAYPHRADGDIGCLIAHGNRKRVIHEIPVVSRLTVRKLEPPMRLTTDSAMTTIRVRMLFGSPLRDSSAASPGEARLIRTPVSTK